MKALRYLNKWVQRASPKFEFLIVILIAFGYFVIGSLFSLFFRPENVLITDRDLTFLLLYEPIVFFILGWFLTQRGWTLTKLGLTPSWKSTLIGVCLVPTGYAVYALVWILLALLLPEVQAVSYRESLSGTDISFWQIILVSVVNPIFENVFVCGYIIQFLKNSNSLWIALIASTAIRTLCSLSRSPGLWPRATANLQAAQAASGL